MASKIELFKPDVEELQPYLLRPVRDREAGLGAELLALLMERGVDADAGELALTCAVSMWAEQRHLCGDRGAIQRLANNADGLRSQGRFSLKVGEDFVRMVQGEIENGRRTLDQGFAGETAEPAPSGKVIVT